MLANMTRRNKIKKAPATLLEKKKYKKKRKPKNKSRVVIVGRKPIMWTNATSNEKHMAGFCSMRVAEAIEFFSIGSTSLPINKYHPVPLKSRSSEQNLNFLGANMVRSALFAPTGRWSFPIVKDNILDILSTLNESHFVLLTIYELKGIYDADLGVGGAIENGEDALVAAHREYEEETGMQTTPQMDFCCSFQDRTGRTHTIFIAKKATPKKKIQICTTVGSAGGSWAQKVSTVKKKGPVMETLGLGSSANGNTQQPKMLFKLKKHKKKKK